jgi:diguanylate cyclase (GGDEF)-like protein
VNWLGTSSDVSRPVPLRALLLSILAFSAPLLGLTVAPEWTTGEEGMLLWLTALLPPFLLTYYKGWSGASIGLAAGMAALVVTNLGIVLLGATAPHQIFVLWIMATYIAVCVGAGFLGDLLRKERRAAEEMALTDPLTGLPNRRHAAVFLDAAFSAAARGQPVSVVLFRLDQVEKINDRFGNRTGEQVMRRFGAILTELTRRMDLSARWEGGVFVSILSRCKAGGAAAFTGRVQEEIRADVFPWGKVTVSAGIAEFEPGMGSPDLLVAAADRALFMAREESTDRYVIAGTRAEAFLEREPPSHPSAQRGGLRLENQPHGGFQLVPAPRSEAESAAVQGDTELPVANPSERVFVVHGDGTHRAYIAGIMKRLGYSVESAASGEAALEAMEKREPPHLLITDLVLPGMGGFTLVEKLERERGPQRVVYLAGYVQEEVTWRGAPGCRVGFVGKPVMEPELAVASREVLDLPSEAIDTGQLQRSVLA